MFELLKIKDGSRPPSLKIENMAHLGNRLTDPQEIHDDANWASQSNWQVKL